MKKNIIKEPYLKFFNEKKEHVVLKTVIILKNKNNGKLQ